MTSVAETVHVFYKLSLFGVDISITSAVIVLWLALFIVFILSFVAVRRASIVPGKLQSVFEILYEFWESQIKDVLGNKTQTWLPFVFALFALILVCNLLGMIPGVYPLTANINLTVTLAIIVFFVYHIAGIKELGPWRYLKSLMPEGVPWVLFPLMLIIELSSHLARPLSLALRLFANMTAGHLITITLLSLIIIFKNIWITGFPLLGRIVIGLFEVFVAFIQAYVFAYLSALYIGLAVSAEE